MIPIPFTHAGAHHKALRRLKNLSQESFFWGDKVPRAGDYQRQREVTVSFSKHKAPLARFISLRTLFHTSC